MVAKFELVKVMPVELNELELKPPLRFVVNSIPILSCLLFEKLERQDFMFAELITQIPVMLAEELYSPLLTKPYPAA